MNQPAILFPGQGAQVVGMAATLVETHAEARQLFERAHAILGYDLGKVCFEGPPELLNSTVHSQPALFVASLAALEQLRTTSPEIIDRAQATAGLSLGEYTSLVFAGVLEFEDGLKVVQKRGEAMQAASDANPSGMVSLLGLELPVVEGLCDEARGEGVLQVANFLCPGNIVVSGDTDACERIAPLAEAAGAMKVIPLAVAGAFHTPLMQSAVAQLEAVLAEVPMKTPRIPVVSNVDARSHGDPEEIRRLLTEQVVRPVQWEGSIRYMLEQGIDGFYEVGPGRVLRSLLKRINRKVKCENISA